MSDKDAMLWRDLFTTTHERKDVMFNNLLLTVTIFLAIVLHRLTLPCLHTGEDKHDQGTEVSFSCCFFGWLNLFNADLSPNR